VDSAVEADVVAAGCVVELRFAGDDETVEYLVGSIEERHEKLDVLSTASPLGQAVLGAAPGDQRAYEGPRGQMEVEVVGVRPPS
jgi:transcription elongation factor GreA